MRFDTIKPKAHRREVAQAFRFLHARTAECALQWRHNGRDTTPNHQPHDCLLKRLFRRRSKKTSKLRVTGLCAGNSPGIGEFPAQMASDARNVSIWWRHHGMQTFNAASKCTVFYCRRPYLTHSNYIPKTIRHMHGVQALCGGFNHD